MVLAKQYLSSYHKCHNNSVHHCLCVSGSLSLQMQKVFNSEHFESGREMMGVKKKEGFLVRVWVGFFHTVLKIRMFQIGGGGSFFQSFHCPK